MKCSVCGAENEDLALVCTSCKSFLQSKVDALDLWDTLWRLVESPKGAFKRIVLSHHKNYVFLLSGLLGASMVFGAIWYKKLGPLFGNVLELIGAGLVAGPPLGILFVALASLLLAAIIRLFGKKAAFRNLFAVMSYAAAPIIFSLVVILPLEVALFGLDFFGQNPSPMVLKPLVYVTLLVFDGAAILWSWILLTVGVSAASRLSGMKSMLVTCLLLLVVGGAVLNLGSL